MREYAGSISVVGDDAVAMVGSTHHSEIINRAAGAMIQRNSGEESLTAIRSPVLSGPGSCGVFLFLENSVPIRPVGFCNVNEMFEINTEEAHAIEVLRGPVGVVYGSGAMHGAINVLQATPGELPRVGFGVEAVRMSFTAASSLSASRREYRLRHRRRSRRMMAGGVISPDSKSRS